MATTRRNAIQKNLDILVEEGASRKVEVPDGPRFLMRIWMKLSNLLEKIRNIHGIEFLDYDISFKGICPEMQGEK